VSHLQGGEGRRLARQSGKPLGRYFPEVVAMLSALAAERFVLFGAGVQRTPPKDQRQGHGDPPRPIALDRGGAFHNRELDIIVVIGAAGSRCFCNNRGNGFDLLENGLGLANGYIDREITVDSSVTQPCHFP
jgi:hypothetical protein